MRELSTSIEYNVRVPMSDGVHLAADVYRPGAPGRHPVLLVRTPYDKLQMPTLGRLAIPDILRTVRSGFVVVVQDSRGTSASEGAFEQFRCESSDGAETVAWAAAQDWSNGSVSLGGSSYMGATQLLAAIARPPALKALLPVHTASEYYEGWVYQGGAFQLGFALLWAATMAYSELLRRERVGPVDAKDKEILESIISDFPAAFRVTPLLELAQRTPLLHSYATWLEHPDRDDYWDAIAINKHYHDVTVPAFHVAGWNDIFVRGSVENYVGMKAGAASAYARGNQRLLVGPWSHQPSPTETVGDVWYGPTAGLSADVEGRQLQFLTAAARGANVEGPPVRIFVMGRNQWRDEDDWPLARARDVAFFAREDGALSEEPPREERPDEFGYDPRNPVPTIGGATLIPGDGIFAGQRDRRRLDGRSDILRYTTSPLPQDLEVTGGVKVTLFVSTSAADTDFTAALVDIQSDGRALGVVDGIRRLGSQRSMGVTPGAVVAVDIDLGPTSYVFRAGSRIRLEVSSSNFPRFDRNPNTGGVIAEARESAYVTARQTVFHDQHRPSHVILPIVS
jgi:hypothetical protein